MKRDHLDRESFKRKQFARLCKVQTIIKLFVVQIGRMAFQIIILLEVIFHPSTALYG